MGDLPGGPPKPPPLPQAGGGGTGGSGFEPGDFEITGDVRVMNPEYSAAVQVSAQERTKQDKERTKQRAILAFFAAAAGAAVLWKPDSGLYMLLLAVIVSDGNPIALLREWIRKPRSDLALPPSPTQPTKQEVEPAKR